MKNSKLSTYDQMILIGATGRNIGKTTLATQIIERYKNQIPIIAFKIITVNDHSDICPRGGKGCGICHSLTDKFDITEEVTEGKKDTMLLKKAGATRVYLIRSFKEHLYEAIEKAMTYVPQNTLILCESNSVRHVIKPGCFIMIQSNATMKPSATSVIEYADYLLDKDTAAIPDSLWNSISLLISNITK